MKFCEQCKTQLADEARYCPTCGRGTQPKQPQQASVQTQFQQAQWTQPQIPVNPPPPKTSKGNGAVRVLFLVLGIVAAGAVTAVLLVTGVLQFRSGAGAAASKVEGPGYDSAEEAARAYAEALKAGDMDAILSTFAMESYVEHFDAVSYYELFRVFYRTSSINSSGALLPVDYGLTAALNLELRRTQTVQYIYYQYMDLLLAGTEYEDTLPYSINAEDVNSLVRLLRQDPEFANMSIGAVNPPDHYLDGNSMKSYTEMYQKYKEQRIQVYGMQDVQDVCLELTISGENYYLFLATARYNGRWYNLFGGNLLSSYLGVNSMYGGLIPVSEVEEGV